MGRNFPPTFGLRSPFRVQVPPFFKLKLPIPRLLGIFSSLGESFVKAVDGHVKNRRKSFDLDL